jgi:hypothetical protein
MKLPRFWVYGPYSSNYGAHALAFEDAEGNQFYFSYDTLVAFRSAKSNRLVVRQNLWGTTTGKHLNAIDGGAKADRVSTQEFEDRYRDNFRESIERSLARVA